MNKKHLTLLLALILLTLSGCSTPATQAPAAGIQQPSSLAAPLLIERDALPSYKSDFSIQFTGEKPWSYTLKTRKSGSLRETALHMEGIERAQNPGDIRLVTDGSTSWMIGEGTDNECVQYPNGIGMDPTFLHPETLISRAQMESVLKPVEEQTVGGVAMLHYQASNVTAGPWSNATLDLWTERDSAMLLKFKLEGTGPDPFFGTGAGKVSALYTATGLGDETIALVEGCELSVPLPASAGIFVRLPGMASFESAEAPEAISSFYQIALPQAGWAEKEAPAQTEGITVLSYLRDSEAVEIHIESMGGGSKVKLLFVPVQ